MMDKAEAAEDAFLTVERQAEGHTLAASGHVRLATAENIANHVIIPALPGFRAQYPNITLEIHTGVTSLNLTRREADIALRLSRPRQGNVSIRKIGEQAYALYGATAYVETLPRTGAKLFKAAEYIGWAEEYGNLAMKEWLEDVAPAHQPILVTHSLFAQLMAAKSGLGLALLPCFLGDAEPGLKRLKSSVDGKTQEIWLVTHQDLKNSRRVSAVADFLTRLVHRNANLFGGKTAE
jgi:DNA-binding transcriptional LysR family regulator